MTQPRTPAGTDDIPAGTKGPTPNDDPRKFQDHSSPTGAIHGGEEKKPGEMPDVGKLENSPRPTGRDGEQEAWKNGSKDGSGKADLDKR
jgi:hypothetical protein